MLGRVWGAIPIAGVALVCFSSSPTIAGTAYGPVQQMLVARSGSGGFITNERCADGWSDITGAAIRIVIPDGANQLVVARFSGLGGSTGTYGGGIRIMAGTREFLPTSLDSAILPQGYLGLPFALERSLTLAPGTRLITVQSCVHDSDPSKQTAINAWHLTVEAAPPQ
jgi:hypothetical protein